jgi:hypothetical protein
MLLPPKVSAKASNPIKKPLQQLFKQAPQFKSLLVKSTLLVLLCTKPPTPINRAEKSAKAIARQNSLQPRRTKKVLAGFWLFKPGSIGAKTI